MMYTLYRCLSFYLYNPQKFSVLIRMKISHFFQPCQYNISEMVWVDHVLILKVR